MSCQTQNDTFNGYSVIIIQRWWRLILGKTELVQDLRDIEYLKGCIISSEYERDEFCNSHAEADIWKAKYQLRELMEKHGFVDKGYITSSDNWKCEDWVAYNIQAWFNAIRIRENKKKPISYRQCEICYEASIDELCRYCSKDWCYRTCETCSPGIPILTKIRHPDEPQCEECARIEICEAFGINPFPK